MKDTNQNIIDLAGLKTSQSYTNKALDDLKETTKEIVAELKDIKENYATKKYVDDAVGILSEKIKTPTSFINMVTTIIVTGVMWAVLDLVIKK